ncbi:MAG: glycosyltransferase family 4 protein [Candidatus Latescibacterota bacterium]|nr:MAG: glycosyltransferase family 4 protein [Candidatus Latescibacterota bacterium]
MTSGSDIRVLMVDSESTWRGGEGQLTLLMRGLLAMDIDVHLAAPPDAAVTAKAGAIGVTNLPLAINGGVDLRAARRLRRYMNDGNYDIVHCHASHAHSVAFIAQKIPGSRRGGAPKLVVSRRVDFPVAKNRLSALKYRRGADLYLAISDGVRDVLIEGGVSPQKIEKVQSGIDLDKFASVRPAGYIRSEFGLDPDTVIVGNVAALAPHKSQIDFVHAAVDIRERIDNVKFFIVGEGEMRDELETAVKSVGLEDDMVMTGFRNDVLEILSVFDCFVLSSYLEGLCTSIMDAQALGIPVVATHTGGVPELVIDGQTGLLVPPRIPKTLADAVVRMIGDEELRASCVAGGRARAKSYDYRVMVQKTAAAYRRLLGQTEISGSAAPPAERV